MIDSIKTTEFPSSFINSVDWEHESQKDLVYLQEDMQAFYSSLNDPGKAQIEVFMSDKIELSELQLLQEKARINVCIPQSLIAKIDHRIIRNYERKIDALSF
jgi:hypothetical protein